MLNVIGLIKFTIQYNTILGNGRNSKLFLQLMATGEPGLLGQHAPNLVQVELSPEHVFAIVRLHPTEEQPALDLQRDHRLATHRHAL